MADHGVKALRVWQVSRELSPLAEAGGIKDVVSGLSKALVEQGVAVTAVLPMYKFLSSFSDASTPMFINLRIGGEIEEVPVYTVWLGKVRILLVGASCFADKDRVYTYSPEEERKNRFHHYGRGHLDSDEMNLTLQYAALECAMALREKPHLFHLHDGHCGFLPALMREKSGYREYFENTGALLTIHNGGLVYQQAIENPDRAQELTGLPEDVLEGCRTENGYNPIICAGIYGNLNTVSEGYAGEIIEGTDRNCGELGIILRHKEIGLVGITNGIDPADHDGCSHSPVLESGSLEEFRRKKSECRRRLLKRIGELDRDVVYGKIPESDRPLVTLQSRIAYQKGIDLLLEMLGDGIDDLHADFLIVGEGDHQLEKELANLAKSCDRLCYVRYYERNLSSDVFAGGDFFLIPSRWEPCGLTDFIAQLNGNIPIVHRTGGLVKTIDGVSGLSYSPNSKGALRKKIREAVSLYRNHPSFLQEIRRNAVNRINEKYTWHKVLAEGYLPLYEKIRGDLS